MDSDGDRDSIKQLTFNTPADARPYDEGPAWSPDGTMIAYSTGPRDGMTDVAIMTADGRQLAIVADDPVSDESPDWQTIPAPETDLRCGGLTERGPGVRDVRASGKGMSCAKARALAAGWSAGEQPGNRLHKVGGYDVEAEDFGGVTRVVLTHRGNHDDDRGNDKLAAFLVQP